MRTDEELAPTVTFTVTAGRNVDNAPMSNERWGQFKSDLTQTLRVFGASFYTIAEGSGEYVGMSEKSFVLIGTIDGHAMRVLVRPRLARLARLYGQEAIGLIEQCNTDTLVFADKL